MDQTDVAANPCCPANASWRHDRASDIVWSKRSLLTVYRRGYYNSTILVQAIVLFLFVLYITFELGTKSVLFNMRHLSRGVNITCAEQHLINCARNILVVSPFVVSIFGSFLTYLQWQTQASRNTPLRPVVAALYGILFMVVIPAVCPSVFAFAWGVLGIVGRARLCECNDMLLARGNTEPRTTISETMHDDIATTNAPQQRRLAFINRTDTEAQHAPSSSTFESTIMCQLVKLNDTILPATVGGSSGIIVGLACAANAILCAVVIFGWAFTNIFSRVGLTKLEVLVVNVFVVAVTAGVVLALLIVPAYLNRQCDTLISRINALRWVRNEQTRSASQEVVDEYHLPDDKTLLRVQALYDYARGANGGRGIGVILVGVRVHFAHLYAGATIVVSFVGSQIATAIMSAISEQTESNTTSFQR